MSDEQDSTEEEGVYKVSLASRMFNTMHGVLDDAFVPALTDAEGKPRSFGWIGDAFSSPVGKGRYIVESLEAGRMRIIAYMDWDGRVFTTSSPLDSIDGLEWSLCLKPTGEKDAQGFERGFVQVKTESGVKNVCAFRVKGDRYDIVGSFYDFGENASGLTYSDALGRLYLAFVYRMTLDPDAALPVCGLTFIDEAFLSAPAGKALKNIELTLDSCMEDPRLSPPLTARLLAARLEEVRDANAMFPDEVKMRVVRRAKYSGLFYAGAPQDAPYWVASYARDVASVLNRYELVNKYIGYGTSRSNAAGDASVALIDARLADMMVYVLPAPEPNDEMGMPHPQGEWVVRAEIAKGIESLNSAYPAKIDFRADEECGVASFVARVADERAFEMSEWVDGEIVPVSKEEAVQAAGDFAAKLGLALAKIAFNASTSIDTVEYCAVYLSEAADAERVLGDMRDIDSAQTAAYATFERNAFAADARLRPEVGLIDARAVFADAQGAVFDSGETDDDAFARVSRVLDAASEVNRASVSVEDLEVDESMIPASLQGMFGVEYLRDLNITAGAQRRRAAEQLASALEDAPDSVEGVARIRAIQNEATDPFAVEAANRVMEGLVSGLFECRDKNAVVNCYLGEDEFLSALARANEGYQVSPEGAIRELVEALDEGRVKNAYLDGAEVVYRSFDSHASRLIYNRARAGTLRFEHLTGPFDFAARDRGRRVELVPDSYLMCHLEAEHLLERSFTESDEAVFYGTRAIEIAPTVAAGYRQLGRAFMLTGDAENAETALMCALEVAIQPVDVSVSYYQLGYVLWKKGRIDEAALCYMKSIEAAPHMAGQSMVELHKMAAEHKLDLNAYAARDIDEELVRAGIVLSPLPEVLDMVIKAAAAAVNEGWFGLGRSLLATYLCHKPDDALVNVLRSLEGPGIAD